VSFESSQIVRDLAALQAACDRAGALLFLDVYHHLNVVPFSVRGEGLERAFITGGGYKYCQLGEGAGFLRFPRAGAGDGSAWRPLITGWFAEFGLLAHPGIGGPQPIGYADGPDRFAGATYDPTSHYRAAAVFDFFDRQGLDITLLRQISQHQIARLCTGFDALGLDPAVITRDRSVAIADRAGFLALASARAAAIVDGLQLRGVAADARGGVLRLGPAPYLEDRQIDDALTALGDVVRALG
jgi:kynureninase